MLEGKSIDCEPCIVANHLKTSIPVGVVIIIVAEVKYVQVSISIPIINMWWAQTINPKISIESIT